MKDREQELIWPQLANQGMAVSDCRLISKSAAESRGIKAGSLETAVP